MKTSVKNIVLFPLNLLYRISPKTTLKILFRTKSGYRLNLKNPTTFYEKIQWIKLNYKNPAITKLVDKYTVRSYIQEKARLGQPSYFYRKATKTKAHTLQHRPTGKEMCRQILRTRIHQRLRSRTYTNSPDKSI